MLSVIDIVKMAKSMKRYYVHINDRYILGANETLNMISVIWLPEEIEKRIHHLEEAKNLTVDSIGTIPIDYRILDRMNYMLSHACASTGAPIYSSAIEDGVPIHDSFTNAIGQKASDGATIVKDIENKLAMYTHSTLHPLNKTDKISMDVYDMDKISYLVKFTIDKKKYQIIEYIRFLKL